MIVQTELPRRYLSGKDLLDLYILYGKWFKTSCFNKNNASKSNNKKSIIKVNFDFAIWPMPWMYYVTVYILTIIKNNY